MRAAADYLLGCDVLGADVVITDKKSTAGSAGVLKDTQIPLTPAQLADLDRALTSKEQSLVDAWQMGQANAAQAKEESATFINPLTGKKTSLAVTYDASAKPGLSKADKAVGIGLLVAGSIAVLGLGTTVYLLLKSKWGWAIANFFVLTPVAMGAAAVATVAIAKKGQAA